MVDSVTEFVRPIKIKNRLEGGGKIEIDDEYSDGTLIFNNNLWGLHYKPTALLLTERT